MRARAGHRLLACWLGVACALGCTASRTDPEPPPVIEQRPRVVIRTAGRQLEVAVEVARTDEERARGLMFRDRLGHDEGMLFVFQEDSEHVFWMKNTLIPLDMIFIDSLGTIVGIVSRAEPFTETPRSAGAPSRYVLEVAGGWAAEHGVKNGDRVLFRSLAAGRP